MLQVEIEYEVLIKKAYERSVGLSNGRKNQIAG